MEERIRTEENMRRIIKGLEEFRNSKDFEDLLKLKKKLFWLSEQMGFWNDSLDGEIIESLDRYDEDNFFSIKSMFIDQELTLIDNILFPDLEITIKDKELESLREELLNLQTKYDSYSK